MPDVAESPMPDAARPKPLRDLLMQPSRRKLAKGNATCAAVATDVGGTGLPCRTFPLTHRP